MSMNTTPSGERLHIGIFGRRNAGKSSLMNAITGQNLSIVSDTLGTTTDPVKKAMELLPLGPVMLIDTPGLDDEGSLGSKRVEKAYEALRHCDIVLFVVDLTSPLYENETNFINEIINRKIPYFICGNKSDLTDNPSLELDNLIKISCKTGSGINELKDRIASLSLNKSGNRLVGDLVERGDIAVLVVPIDSAAPKGRLILPQQQTIRDLLESGSVPVVTRESELSDTLSKLSVKPKLVITDSQVFEYVSKIVPEDIFLTSFSILMSRYKGDLSWQIEGVKALDELKDGDKILISEGCTHHRQCGDIGSEKLPKWINEYTNKDLIYSFTSGGEFPLDLSSYKLIIHCGGCTLNESEMKYRIQSAKEQNIPITNYGIAISYMKGILNRCIEIFN